MTLFFGGIFSQWHMSDMTIDNVVYNCAEQFMMARKAALFRDRSALHKIMQSRTPSKQKQLGRHVEGFNIHVWEAVARDVVFRGNMAKFTQHPDLWTFLRATGDTMIVEASPTDLVWGVGLTEDDPLIHDPANWRGRNWLGAVLMDVRRALNGENLQ